MENIFPYYNRFLEKYFKIERSEFRIIHYFLLYFTLIGMFYTIGCSTTETMILSRLSPETLKKILPAVYIGTAITALFLTWLYDKIQSLLPRIKLIVLTQVVLMLSIVLLNSFIKQFPQSSILYYLAVIWLESCSLISIMLFYSYAGDFFTSRDARRLYIFINSGLALGTILAGYLLKPLISLLGFNNLLFFNAGLLILQALIVFSIFRKFVKTEQRSIQGDRVEKAPLNSIFRNPYLILIIVIFIAGLIASRFVEYQFQMTASRALSEEKMALFYGSFFSWIGIIQIPLQYFILRPLLNRFGVIKSLMILPSLILLSSLIFFIHPVLLTAALVNFIRISLYESLDIPSRELLYLPLPKRIRLRTQAIFSGAVIPLGSGIGGILLILFTNFTTKIHHFALYVISLSLVWLVSIYFLKSRYRKILSSSLRKCELALYDVTSFLNQGDRRVILDELLNSKDKGTLRLAMDLVQDKVFAAEMNKFIELSSSDDETVAFKAFELLGLKKEKVDMAIFIRGIGDKRDRVRLAALSAFGQVWGKEVLKYGDHFLEDQDPGCKLQYLVWLDRYGEGEGKLLVSTILEKFITSPDSNCRILALKIIAQLKYKAYIPALLRFLYDPDPTIRFETVKTCAGFDEPELIPHLLRQLDDHKMRPCVFYTLTGMPQWIEPYVIEEYEKHDTVTINRILLLKILGKVGAAESIDILSNIVFSQQHYVLRVIAARELRQKISSIDGKYASDIEALIRQTIHNIEVVQAAQAEIAIRSAVISGLYADRNILNRDFLFSLLILYFRNSDLGRIELNLGSHDKITRDNAIELLDSILPSEYANTVISLLAGVNRDEGTDRIRGNRISTGIDGLSRKTAINLYRSDSWIRHVTLYYYKNYQEELEEVLGMDDPNLNLVNLIADISFLKEIPIFQNIPSEYLASLAETMSTIYLYQGEVLYTEGEPGNSLYIIKDGGLAIFSAETEILRLGPKESVGEMALIDNQAHTTRCVATKDARLLQITSEEFYNLLDTHPEIAKAMLRTLSQRIRKIRKTVGKY